MRCTYIGLAAALCWAGASGSKLEAVHVGGHRILADVGSHRKNASSASLSRSRGGIDDGADVRYSPLELRQAGGRCGQQYGKCPDNLCCSDYGFCGDSVDHCAPLFDCQAEYGVCGWPRTAAQPPAATTAPPAPTTTTAAPPPPSTTTSAAAPPSSTTTSRASSQAPQPPASTVATAPVATPTGLRVTTNGMCGNGTMCIGSTQFGPCCSQFFWCGSTLDFCGAGCHSEFGACLGSVPIPGGPASNVSTSAAPTSAAPTSAAPTSAAPTSAAPTTAAPVTPTSSAAPSSTAPAQPTVSIPAGMRSSTDGKCGTGVTCLGSTFGRCCSQFGYCGDGDQFCPPIVGCQPQFGYCDPGRT